MVKFDERSRAVTENSENVFCSYLLRVVRSNYGTEKWKLTLGCRVKVVI